jgi:hypothetical protein
MTVAKGLSICKLYLVGLQEVTWDGCGTDPANKYTNFYGKENENQELSTGLFVYDRM